MHDQGNTQDSAPTREEQNINQENQANPTRPANPRNSRNPRSTTPRFKGAIEGLTTLGTKAERQDRDQFVRFQE